MIKSKKLQKFKNIKHGFFNNIGGVSSGVYKSLNCGIGSHDNKKNVIKNLKIVSKKIGVKKKIILLHQLHSNKIYFTNKISKNNREKVDSYIGIISNHLYLDNLDSVISYSKQINNYDKMSRLFIGKKYTRISSNIKMILKLF